MLANDFFDFAEGRLKRAFDENGVLPDTALTWDGAGKDVRMVDIHDEDGTGPDALKAVLSMLGHVAYAVGYEARLTDSNAASEAMADGRHGLDEVKGTVDDGEALPEHVVFLFMAAIDGDRRVRAFEVMGGDRKKLGERLPALEDGDSPFANLFDEEVEAALDI